MNKLINEFIKIMPACSTFVFPTEKMAVSEDRASLWVHKDLTVKTKYIWALLTAAWASEGKDECQVRLTGIEREHWISTEIGRLGGHGFRGTFTAGDGSNPKGEKMGAGYVNLRGGKKRQQRKDPARTFWNLQPLSWQNAAPL